jgi:hypothetical protein
VVEGNIVGHGSGENDRRVMILTMNSNEDDSGVLTVIWLKGRFLVLILLVIAAFI